MVCGEEKRMQCDMMTNGGEGTKRKGSAFVMNSSGIYIGISTQNYYACRHNQYLLPFLYIIKNVHIQKKSQRRRNVPGDVDSYIKNGIVANVMKLLRSKSAHGDIPL